MADPEYLFKRLVDYSDPGNNSGSEEAPKPDLTGINGLTSTLKISLDGINSYITNINSREDKKSKYVDKIISKSESINKLVTGISDQMKTYIKDKRNLKSKIDKKAKEEKEETLLKVKNIDKAVTTKSNYLKQFTNVIVARHAEFEKERLKLRRIEKSLGKRFLSDTVGYLWNWVRSGLPFIKDAVMFLAGPGIKVYSFVKEKVTDFVTTAADFFKKVGGTEVWQKISNVFGFFAKGPKAFAEMVGKGLYAFFTSPLFLITLSAGLVFFGPAIFRAMDKMLNGVLTKAWDFISAQITQWIDELDGTVMGQVFNTVSGWFVDLFHIIFSKENAIAFREYTEKLFGVSYADIQNVLVELNKWMEDPFKQIKDILTISFEDLQTAIRESLKLTVTGNAVLLLFDSIKGLIGAVKNVSSLLFGGSEEDKELDALVEEALDSTEIELTDAMNKSEEELIAGIETTANQINSKSEMIEAESGAEIDNMLKPYEDDINKAESHSKKTKEMTDAVNANMTSTGDIKDHDLQLRIMDSLKEGDKTLVAATTPKAPTTDTVKVDLPKAPAIQMPISSDDAEIVAATTPKAPETVSVIDSTSTDILKSVNEYDTVSLSTSTDINSSINEYITNINVEEYGSSTHATNANPVPTIVKIPDIVLPNNLEVMNLGTKIEVKEPIKRKNITSSLGSESSSKTILRSGGAMSIIRRINVLKKEIIDIKKMKNSSEPKDMEVILRKKNEELEYMNHQLKTYDRDTSVSINDEPTGVEINGGIVQGEILAVVGEGKYEEYVIPGSREGIDFILQSTDGLVVTDTNNGSVNNDKNVPDVVNEIINRPPRKVDYTMYDIGMIANGTIGV